MNWLSFFFQKFNKCPYINVLVQIYIDPNISTQVPDLGLLCTCRYVLVYIYIYITNWCYLLRYGMITKAVLLRSGWKVVTIDHKICWSVTRFQRLLYDLDCIQAYGRYTSHIFVFVYNIHMLHSISEKCKVVIVGNMLF